MSNDTPDDDPVSDADVREALEKAVQMQRRGQLAKAEEVYAAVLTLRPEEPNALNFLGILRHQQGKQDEALHYLGRAIQQQPANPGPWLNLSNVLLEAGEYTEAVAAMRRVVELKPDSAGVYNNLAILHMRLGHLKEAEKCLAAALERDPNPGFLHANLGNLYYRTGRYKESIEHSLRSLGGDRKNDSARWILTLSLLAHGERDRAILNLRDWIEDEPDNPRPRHHLTALGVGEVPQRASDAYVKDMFDSFATSFDQKLEKLGYRAPQLVCDALLALGDRLRTGGCILDAGCGTGLCGPLLRPLAERLEGVDLSEPMLARATGRNCYDALHAAELTAFIDAAPDRFDNIASADTLVYFGDLGPVMAAARRALKPGGALAASVEALPDDHPDRHLLQVNGRYAHSQAYLREVAEQHGLEMISLQPEILRKELGDDVHGWVFVAIRPA
ncbi:tetratricopeptide repeat protein [Piscinibacter sakaiensis]|uniref:tetratricopeptide repeat protein n=1 Tax=Piscinibacter sakaiensis TaxID=1547922 RepID=UPI003AADACB9